MTTRTDGIRPPLLAEYKNGNYTVRLYADGTKIKYTPDDAFRAEFPDSIDLKITNCCDMNCPMCHESSSPEEEHGDLNASVLNTVRSGTELAIGGGNPLAHPQLLPFLRRMKARGVVCNLTVNEVHFLRSRAALQDMLAQHLIRGLGISLQRCDEETLSFAACNPAVVLHLICGVADGELLGRLYDRNLKLLFLGYKKHGRGAEFYSAAVEEKIAWLRRNIRTLAPKFNTLCFDNLALEQLELRLEIAPELFEERYMGDDGSASMYIDLVAKQFAVSSVSEKRYPLCDSVDGAFAFLQEIK